MVPPQGPVIGTAGYNVGPSGNHPWPSIFDEGRTGPGLFQSATDMAIVQLFRLHTGLDGDDFYETPQHVAAILDEDNNFEDVCQSFCDENFWMPDVRATVRGLDYILIIMVAIAMTFGARIPSDLVDDVRDTMFEVELDWLGRRQLTVALDEYEAPRPWHFESSPEDAENRSRPWKEGDPKPWTRQQ